MKKLALFLCFALLLSGKVFAQAAPDISAEACIIMETESGRFLYEKNADNSMLIASTTKILTALVVLESVSPSESVTIDESWTGIEGSSMYLRAGDIYTVYELLAGLMLCSGNDAAVALACYTAGSEAEFAVLMNEKADELGCRNCHFQNASGLDDAQHYASARDLALIACAALQNETLREIFSSAKLTVHGSTFYNHNKLLTRCAGCFGVKTGYTMAAGRTLVSCCERDGMTLLCVTLSDPNDWTDHEALYDWCFSNWQLTEISPETLQLPIVNGDTDNIFVAAGESIYLPLSEDDEISFSYELPSFSYAPIDSGEILGSGTVSVNGDAVMRFSLISQNSAAIRRDNNQPAICSFLNQLGRINYIF